MEEDKRKPSYEAFRSSNQLDGLDVGSHFGSAESFVCFLTAS